MNLQYVPQYTWTLRLTFPNQMDEVKEGAFSITPFKNLSD